MATIQPNDSPELNTMSRQTEQEDLVGREFLTYSSPDLPTRHRILALLRITDIEDIATPAEDGQFASDFYLNAHGNPQDESKIVLDSSILPRTNATGNILVGEQFLGRICGVCRFETPLDL
ncbi:hypothetical protein N7495_006062 [Penicillium taxi]|uniref:uncharacterized protein n=1 Tax=Penicillium taxi TaxID=168475 RepID=UPI002545016C|nr:uncharacterized protein N7495_006062 [Penicillium taxi]KAJ5894371.1 hypothetical protein N7495_006062 [Penicillium taxi]